MTEIERTKLARERTHASWLRTSLAFIVSAIAVHHYTADEWFTPSLLGIAGVFAAMRAIGLAANWSEKLICLALVVVCFAIPLSLV